MKIALIGEYSGLHSSLKVGLEELGHYVDIYSDGDSFKKIPGAKQLYPDFKGKIDQIKYAVMDMPPLIEEISNNYDVIQLVNPHVIHSYGGIFQYYKFILDKLKNSRAIKSLAVAGCETNTQRGLSAMKRSPCPGCLSEMKLDSCKFTRQNFSRINSYGEQVANHIIPFGGFSYATSYASKENCRELTSFPVDISSIPPRVNAVRKKITVLHGINRSGFKGSPEILDALRKLEKDFPDHFEILIPERLEFERYIKLLSSANVVIDQLFGDALGMNALYSMGSSCVVMTAFERLKKDRLDLRSAPAIQLGDTAEKIYVQLKAFLDWSEADFANFGERARAYVDKYNAPATVAAQVLSDWEL